MRFLDKAIVDNSSLRETSDGYLAASVRASRTGIQQYLGSEMSVDQDIVRVYRPESEVFDKSSLGSFANKPVTNDHPPVRVTKRNHKKYAVGHVGEEVARDGEFVRVGILLTDEDVINDVQGGKVEISMGYTMDLDWTAGVTDSGEAYDASMTKLRMNHLAIVDKGRAGPEVRVGDSWTDSKPQGREPLKPQRKPTMDVRTIIVDKLSVKTTEEGAQAIEKLQGVIDSLNDSAETAKTDHKEALDSLKSDHDKAVSDKDEEIGKLKGQVKSLEDAAMTPEKLDVLVADRSELIGKASKIIKDGDFNGKSDADIMKMCTDEHYGKEATDGESEDVVRGMFKAIEISTDSFREAFKSRKAPANVTQLSDSQAAYERRIANGGVDPK